MPQNKNKENEVNLIEIAEIKKLLLNPVYNYDYNELRETEIKVIKDYAEDIKNEFGDNTVNSLLRKSYIEFCFFDTLIINDLRRLTNVLDDDESDVKVIEIQNPAFKKISNFVKPLILDLCKKYNIGRPIDPIELKMMYIDEKNDRLRRLKNLTKWPSNVLKPVVQICQIKDNHLFDSDFIDEDGYLTLKVKTNSRYSKEIILFLLENFIGKYTTVCSQRDNPRPGKPFLDKNPDYENTTKAPPKIRFRDNIILALDVWETWLKIFDDSLTTEKAFKKIAAKLKIKEQTAKSRWYRAYSYIFDEEYSKNLIIHKIPAKNFCLKCDKRNICDPFICSKLINELKKVSPTQHDFMISVDEEKNTDLDTDDYFSNLAQKNEADRLYKFDPYTMSDDNEE